tara:strand:- start:116 stop:355 length:240 start_codon:yes stop_codon:yes gene_type:complete
METEIIKVYGADWCPDCIRAKSLLDDEKVPYKYIDIGHAPEAEEYVRNLNDGKRIIPTIIFPDGRILVEPSNATLLKNL